jgi:threonylcarbamoyladenosine tRNA methylthiotransferase MtaB
MHAGEVAACPWTKYCLKVAQLGAMGFREVVLTGIHIGCYGQDLAPSTSLYQLLCRIRDSGIVPTGCVSVPSNRPN